MRPLKIKRLQCHFRGRKTGLVRTEFFIGRVAHFKFKCATVDYVSMAEPDLIQRFAIEPDALDVLLSFELFSQTVFSVLPLCRLIVMRSKTGLK